MLYQKNTAPKLTAELFSNPTSEYRGTPFWAWNCELDGEQLLRQIDCFKEMGLGGFHMHVRTGMATDYLSEEFFGFIKLCVEKAKKEKMLAWLYDEDRWPSGAAGGIITKDEKYRARYLLFTTQAYSDVNNKKTTFDASARAVRTENGSLIASFDVELNPNGTLKSYKSFKDGDTINGVQWYAYLEQPEGNPWYNNQTYVNTLDKAAIDEFCRVTHEGYKAAVGDDFGGVIPAIFTDEPQFTHKTALGFAGDKKDITLPWTDDIPKTYKSAYGEDILLKLPELFWNLENGVSLTRYRYHDHISERFATAFSDNIGAWCDKNNLMLTGHMMEEPTLFSQTAALGEVMRSLSSFQLPGVDMLCDSKEYSTAKQAQSVAHQYGREGVLSELYGVTNWDFDFRGHKLQGDWQAALGITVRVPHLSWVSMGGEAKRDYPASISYQSPWFKEYPYVENHFARVNTAMTRGKPIVKVAVIHPVESYWLHWGPQEQTAPMREHLDNNFRDITDWLLLGQIDFNYISEALFPTQNEKGSLPLKVGKMTYETVIVPGCLTMRSTTVERLEQFVDCGGKLIFMGEIAKLVNAVPSDRVLKLALKSTTINFTKFDILAELETAREVKIVNGSGILQNNLLYQLREDKDERWLFISHSGNNIKCDFDKDIPNAENVDIAIKGDWTADVYDTLTGEIAPIATRYKAGNTHIAHTFFAYDSLLLNLKAGKTAQEPCMNGNLANCFDNNIVNKVKVSLSEPNALLLDLAEYAFDEQAYKPLEEILRIDDYFRDELQIPSRKEAVAQPWVIEKEIPTHTLHLRFLFESEIDVDGASLAIEKPELATISLNGETVSTAVTGWYVDEDIKTIALSKIVKGHNVLDVALKFGKQTNTEWCYIVGDFGVRVEGVSKIIVAPVKELAFGDITTQGLPFYGGNIDYHFAAETSDKLTVHANQYRGALIGVSIDGKRRGRIVYPPYNCTVEGLKPGMHDVTLTLFGNRVNGFGAVHLCDGNTRWFGPDGWRSSGDRFSYEYNLKKIGILKSPTWTSCK